MTDTLLAFFKALADRSRLEIVGLLAHSERSVQELAQLLDLKEPTVSHHLAVLKAQGLVTARAEGATRWHRLDNGALEAMARRVLESASGEADPAPAAGDDARILAGFVRDGRLEEIPASRRKRVVILRWLVQMFEPDRRYPEREVNDILKARHWDCATLRRELVGHRMMTRERGVYWRLPQEEWRDETLEV